MIPQRFIFALMLTCFFMFFVGSVALAQSPHGTELTISCAECHLPDSWKPMDSEASFNHRSTRFPLTGQHQSVNCKACHENLVFSPTQSECLSCHTDVHEESLGQQCERCHSTQSWLMSDKTRLHEQSRFPLLGAHAVTECADCHRSGSFLRFDPLGINCVDCHLDNYNQTTNPDHRAGAFSTDCTVCHSMNAFTWTGAGSSHFFFPLTEGHALTDCFSCHDQGQPYNSISPDCIHCHQADYQSASNPNHQVSGFSTDCAQCHTTSQGWKPAKMGDHDGEYFPIYSGKHQGEWNSCTDCHTNASNYSSFSCIDCHEHTQAKMDSEHDEEGDYSWNSNACLHCHPDGRAED